MAKRNKGILVGTWMSELELSKLEYIQEKGESRSSAIRRVINEKWCDEMHEADKGYSISDRVNCL